jgi:hypothetical protein
MLCALALSAAAAQSASAATKGTTGFTCVKGQGSLKGSHCLTTGGGSAEFGHVAYAENTTTEVQGTNANTSSETTASTNLRLALTIGGAEVELEATGLAGAGWTENKLAEGEHYLVDGGSTVFSGVSVVKPAGKGCKVFTDETATKTKGAEGVIDTGPISVTSKGQGDFLKFEPGAGSAFATFFLECTTSVPSCEGTWEITGTMKAPVSGATVIFSHSEITAQNTLRAKGVKAALEGKVTISARDPAAGDKSFTPLSVTTVETP